MPSKKPPRSFRDRHDPADHLKRSEECRHLVASFNLSRSPALESYSYPIASTMGVELACFAGT